MTFRKGLSLFLALVMLVTLCACGKKQADTAAGTTTTATTAVTTTTTVAETTEAATTTTTATTTTAKPTSPTVAQKPAVDGVQNILFFGLDERGVAGKTTDEAGKAKSYHSDSIMILTIDRRDAANPRIKMTSLARDTLVYVEGYNSKDHKTKLTVAFDYGYRVAKQKGKNEEDSKHAGAKTAIKTIKQNFGIAVTDYVFVSFVEFAEVIDYLGGVTVDVQPKELTEMNKHIKAANKECGTSVKTVASAGQQRLTGGQALAYCRIRKIDNDLKRTERQRTVLKSLFNEVKSTPLAELPGMVSRLTSLCHTNLSAAKIVELATWAFTNAPTFKSYTLPNSSCNMWGDTHPTYGWVWIYDMHYASALLYDFLYDADTAKSLTKPTKYRLY